MQSGFILINKPVGPTSHTIVNKLRRITSIKKIGHAGTLDPFADGLLILAIGRESTKKISNFVKLDKEYVASLILGATTDTYDNEGTIKRFNSQISQYPIKDEILAVLESFLGKQAQIPPMFSAKKVQGQKLYELARQGIEIERQPSQIEIFSIELMEYNYPHLQIKVHCSSGTYIRSLGHDIGQKLECGAYLENLKRTKIGRFDVKDSTTLEELTKENWENYLFIPSPCQERAGWGSLRCFYFHFSKKYVKI